MLSTRSPEAMKVRESRLKSSDSMVSGNSPKSEKVGSRPIPQARAAPSGNVP